MTNQQGTEEWKLDRVGFVTASRFKDVMTTIKSGEAAARYNYKAEIIAEQLTGLPTDSYTTVPMQWGIDHEAEARAIYEAIKGVKVNQTGFIKHPTLKTGASPDGLIDDDGGLEIKCPNSATHIMTLLSGKMPKIHYAQVQGAMWITGRQWWDFMSYDPRMDAKRAVFIVRVYRDEDYIDALSNGVEDFLDEVSELMQELEAIK